MICTYKKSTRDNSRGGKARTWKIKIEFSLTELEKCAKTRYRSYDKKFIGFNTLKDMEVIKIISLNQI